MTRILVVEDSPTQAEELRLILESEQFDVEVAPDGEAGFRRLGQGDVDLIISDIMMPGLTGYELCRRVKADPVKRAIPVILLTTLSDPMDIIQGLECGADNFITKPYEAKHLLARVKEILENRNLRRGGPVTVGVEIYFLGRKFTVTSDKEQILGLLISTFEDVVRTHQALKNSHRDLAGRTDELEEAERALRLKTDQLEASNNDLEMFSYSVSHDLRAPLRAIDGFSKMIVDEHSSQLDAEGLRKLGVIQSSAETMSRIIDALLTLARGGQRPLEVARIPMEDVVREVLAELGIPRAGVECRIGPLPGALADRALIRQVWANLLGNALKYSAPKNEIRIDIEGREEGEDVTYLVRDNGVGFDMKYAGKLFRAFQRLHSRKEFEGSGIGLALVERIVRRHGGRVWAEGTPGEGAAFHFTLPRPGGIRQKSP